MFKAMIFAAVVSTSPFDITPASPAAVVSASDEATIDRLADTFFGKLKGGRYQEAYADAFSSPLMRKRSMEVEQVAGQTEAAFKVYGAPQDWEVMAEQNVSQTFVRRYYIVRTENLPVFFTIEYYSFGGKWSILNIAFQDSFKNIQ